ncbi:MAG TPA: ABC transporter six-transmembrane domain-containing protein [Hymenobacter sp.]|uniref:ABC transporter six-transmembrane domain-containing protein n=1 Tax=Hymenobacter sp. TaxID=1898978 RepID=UPI002D7FE51C|nr:ABC transporter six-transmembrane domain-containing protein [Hymenobacter sp.]HET9503251.1 ABC transporter six-transmembrane domain-containing protein [Hymenobacter sp.]
MNPSSFPLPAAERQRSSAFRTLTALARAHPGRLAVTLGLVALENVLMLAYPLFAGFAVDAILRGDTAHALWYAVVVLAFWLVGAARRAVDTRTFTRLYAELAVGVVLAQRQQAQSTSTAAARVVLAREFVDFFEHHVPAIATALVSMAGAAVMLLVLEWKVGAACVTALLSCLAWVPAFARRNEALHQRINNRLEQEVALVETVGPAALRRHYTVLSSLRIWLSDREASAYLAIGALAALLFGLLIALLAATPGIRAGHVSAVMTYLWTFVMSLNEAPGVVDQLARLRDIGRRVAPIDVER